MPPSRACAVFTVTYLCLLGEAIGQGFSGKLDHVTDVLSLPEGSQYTYDYNCAEERAVLCHYYPGQEPDYPEIGDDQDGLPDLLKSVMTLTNKSCPGYEINIASFKVTVSISGLIVFYSPESDRSSCSIGSSSGPRPLLFNVTEAQQCDGVNTTTESTNGKLAHVTDVLSLPEGSQYTYDYNCTEEKAVLCHYYPGQQPDYPVMERGQNRLPDLLKSVMTLSEKKCPGYDINIASFNVTVSISGLIVFYSPEYGSCSIGSSSGPRPLLFNVTAQQCEGVNTTTKSTNTQDMLSHQPLPRVIKEGEQLKYSCPCGPNVVVCVYNEQLDELQVLGTSLIESVTVGEHYCNGTLAQGPIATITGSLDLSETTFFCAENVNKCALHFSIGERPIRVQTLATHMDNTSTLGGSCEYDEEFIPAVVSLVVFLAVVGVAFITTLVMIICLRPLFIYLWNKYKQRRVHAIAQLNGAPGDDGYPENIIHNPVQEAYGCMLVL